MSELKKKKMHSNIPTRMYIFFVPLTAIIVRHKETVSDLQPSLYS